jgi:hypothetical protein
MPPPRVGETTHKEEQRYGLTWRSSFACPVIRFVRTSGSAAGYALPAYGDWLCQWHFSSPLSAVARAEEVAEVIGEEPLNWGNGYAVIAVPPLVEALDWDDPEDFEEDEDEEDEEAPE